jgi:hypothetical protein
VIDPGVAWIRSDLEPGPAAYTVAHELRHVQQGRVGGGRFAEAAAACEETYEAGAHAYAKSMYSRWPLRRL